MTTKRATRWAAIALSAAVGLMGAVAVPAASAAGAGTIAGVVRDGSGAVVPDVAVSAHRVGGGVWSDDTGEDGDYTLSGLTPGQYRVQFDAADAAEPLLAEWFDGARDFYDAQLVTVSDGAVTTADASLQAPASVSGTVIGDDSLLPIEGVGVTAYRVSSSGDAWAADAATDVDGGYELTGLWPGTYRIAFEPTSGWVPESWDDADAASATLLTLSAGETLTGIDAALAEAGVISGTVTDPEGRPVAQATVFAHLASGGAVAEAPRTTTDENGAFVLRGLDPEAYVVEFQAPYESELRGEWWDDSPTRAEAEVIELFDRSMAGVDAQLARGGVISGTVREASGPIDHLPVSAFPADCSDPVEPLVTYTDAAGAYALTGLAAGEYRIRFGDPETIPTGLAARWWNGATECAASAVVTVTGAATVGDIDATLGGSITGTVRGAGNALLGGVSVRVYRDGAASPAASATTNAGGAFALRGLRAGSYRVSFGEAGLPGQYLREWWKDAATRDAATVVTIVAGQAAAPLAVTLALRPVTLATPTITGTAQVGQKLTAPAAPTGQTFRYEWRAGGAVIAGAASRTLTLAAAQAGKNVTVTVTAAQAGYASTTKSSAPTAAVRPGVLSAATPTVTGTYAVGATLTAKPGTWTAGTTLKYQWLSGGKAISGATASALKLGTRQKGTTISVRVTGTKAGFTTVSKTSKVSAKVATAGTPTISGSAKVDSKLTAKPGTWTSGTTLSYQWRADGVAIAKATKPTFTLTRSQAGKAITVTVTGRKSGYATVAKTSKATSRVLASATPTISGRTYATLVLTAKTGSWSPGTTFSYRWYAGGTAISGATKNSLTLTEALAGKRITVAVTGRQGGYTAVSKTSTATAAVKSGKSRPATKTTCPSAYPIKGNQTTRHTTDWIYHVPGGQYYGVTHPEECFVSERAAQQAGYRASMR